MTYRKGDRVRLHVKHLLPGNPTPYFVVEGTIIDSEKHDPPGTIRVFTGNPFHPVSVIALHNILFDANTEKPKPEEKKEKEKEEIYNVKGSKGDSYTVVVKGNYAHCNCMGFQYRKRCKHADEILKKARKVA